ncbi:fibulin-1-like [Frankliniella occidentalis]|uniref:Fibulin-1-like n=1 Tax=Frankliniella occidentalis TaxID=133901 RepID=A0A9C6TXG0_FRAOC|nr:fibulin-1-like [Frankliniella occidentalis]
MPSTNRPSAPPPPSAQCPAGFRLSEAERRCLDVDECADAKLHICNNVTELCINEPGGYRCVKRDSPAPLSASPPAVPARPLGAGRCDPGYMYSFHNQKCVDEDECIRNPCDSNQVCHNTVGSYSCECKEGFARDPLTTACVDINECQLGINHCAASQRCDNTIGSYQCIRYSGCGTGYTLNAATGTCDDDDECELGTDNCRESGPTWVCRNTQGSFRCERKQCEPDYQLLPSGECVRIDCDPGYAPAANTSKCVDIDECSIGSPCGRGRRCVNTPGSYQCVFRIQCRPGFVPSPEGDRCVDEDECATGTHNCKPGQTCFNRPGTYQCQCPPGHTLDETKNCVDVDECERFPRQACSDLATCENTVGSYRCHCKEGYRQGRGKSCDDIDECAETPNLCQQQCINVWGSYRCSCERGFYLHTDNRTCIDIDECQVHKDRHLCVGDCLNTLGSYRCHCPSGYRLSKDGRNCVDIDECATGEKCRQPGEICINMQGSFRCNTIRCPEGYVNDNSQKNRCRRIARGCPPNDHECRRQPQLMTFNFMTLVSNMSIPASGALDLFVMRGALTADTHTLFSLDLDSARAPVGVPAATRANFKLSQVRDNQAVVALVRPLAGPQDVELRLVMEVYSGSFLAGLNVAKLFLFVSEHPY